MTAEPTKRPVRADYHRQWYQKNREKILARKKEYREQNRERDLAKKRVWMHAFAQRRAEAKGKEYRPRRRRYSEADNALAAYKRPINPNARKEWWNRRLKEDPSFRLACAFRSNVHTYISRRNIKKSARTELLCGCSVLELRMHLESKFKPGMSWDNYGRGGWHIDHIRPCASFDLTDPVQQSQCFHFTNLQPLWQRENIQKGNKLSWV